MLESVEVTVNENDIYENGGVLPGTYTLTLDIGKVKVYCLAGGWTVFQSRGQFGNPTDYFLRGWSEYEDGFGIPGKEHWLGLKAIHKLTNFGVPMQLRIEMMKRPMKAGALNMNLKPGKISVQYDNFTIQDQVH